MKENKKKQKSDTKKKMAKIVFKTHDLGEPLDSLTRSYYYPDPI